MIIYAIKDALEESTLEECLRCGLPYAAILNPEEWAQNRERFDLGIDMELDLEKIRSTKAELNHDSLTGTFRLPDRRDLSEEQRGFAFALDEKGVIFIDKGITALGIVQSIVRNRKRRFPGLERFLYDFLEEIIRNDSAILEEYEDQLDLIEDRVFDDKEDMDPRSVNGIRNDLRTLRIHYEQLMDLGQELEENENSFFQEENLRFFHMFNARVTRLHTITVSLRDYAMQLRDLNQAQTDMKQNRIMTVLTVVTSIFMPLTLITGWYGMNFQNMPELSSKHGYPGVIVLSMVIVITCLLVFRKKKWL